MGDESPTAIIKMIQKLKSESSTRRDTSFSTNSPPSMSFNTLNDSDKDDFISPKRKRLNSTGLSQDVSSHQAMPSSPWEWRRLKGEIVSLRARIAQQESHIQHLHNMRKQMEEILENETKILKSQLYQDKQTIKQLELRVDVGKRTIQDLRESKAELEKEFHQTKIKLEKEIAALKEAELILSKPEEKKEESEKKQDEEKEKLEKENAELKEKIEVLEERINQLQDKTKSLLISQRDIELQSIELQNAKIKIERLEYEKSMWEESKLLTNKAARATDLEKELNAAKEMIAALRESVQGKLLLEEQMTTLKQRLEHTEKLEQQVATLQANQIELSSKLNEYESVGITGGPAALKRELYRLQQSELLLMSEESQLKSKLDSIQKECNNLLKKYEEAKKLAAELANSSEKTNKFMSRLQKKVLLVSRERDSYRQQLDVYEKEISTDSNNLAHDKIVALESALHGYRELVAKLESDLESADGMNLREECNKLRNEVARLQNEFEHRALKGDFNCDAKILHYQMNPAAIAGKAAEEKHIAMQKELEELRAKVASGCGGDVGMSSLQAQEMQELKQSHELKIARLKEVFKAASQEFRQACYQLFGWRVDRTKEGMYKLFSQYAESADDFLCFQMNNDDDNLLLLETAFSATLNEFIERHLHIQSSIPMFLCAVQTELFSQQTMAKVMK